MKIFWVSAVLLIPVGPIHAEEPAPVKDGLWSIHTQFIEHPREKKNDTIGRGRPPNKEPTAESSPYFCREAFPALISSQPVPWMK